MVGCVAHEAAVAEVTVPLVDVLEVRTELTFASEELHHCSVDVLNRDSVGHSWYYGSGVGAPSGGLPLSLPFIHGFPSG